MRLPAAAADLRPTHVLSVMRAVDQHFWNMQVYHTLWTRHWALDIRLTPLRGVDAATLATLRLDAEQQVAELHVRPDVGTVLEGDLTDDDWLGGDWRRGLCRCMGTVLVHVVCAMDKKIKVDGHDAAFRAIHEWVYGAPPDAAHGKRVLVDHAP